MNDQENLDETGEDLFGDLPFGDLNSNMLHIRFTDEIGANGNSHKRTYERVDLEDNQIKRLSFHTELLVYITFHLRPFLISLLSLTQSRVLLWLALGELKSLTRDSVNRSRLSVNPFVALSEERPPILTQN